jgi:hypothetical protein
MMVARAMGFQRLDEEPLIWIRSTNVVPLHAVTAWCGQVTQMAPAYRKPPGFARTFLLAGAAPSRPVPRSCCRTRSDRRDRRPTRGTRPAVSSGSVSGASSNTRFSVYNAFMKGLSGA